MNLQKIVSFIVRGVLIPVIAVSGPALVLSGCATDGDTDAEAAEITAEAGTGVFSGEYMEKYMEYEAFLQQLAQNAGDGPRDEFFQARARHDRARLGRLMLEKGLNPGANPYPALLLKVKAAQACAKEMAKFDFAVASYKDELALHGLMMQFAPEAIEAAAAAVADYPETDLTDGQLEVLANLRKSDAAFAVAPAYLARFEELTMKLAAARDARKAEYDAGKLSEKDMTVITSLLDKARIGLKRLQKGVSARPGLIERSLDTHVHEYIYRLIREDLHAGKATYIETFKAKADKLNAEARLLKDWRMDDRLRHELAALHLSFPREPLSDDVVDRAVDIRARRAPAGGSYDYVQKVKEIVNNRKFLNGFCLAEYGAGRLPEEVFIENAYYWDLDRLALAELEDGGNREPGSIEAVMALKLKEYLRDKYEAAKKTGRELDTLKIELFEAQLEELEKTAAVSESSMKKLRRGLEGYPDEPLKDNRIKYLLNQKNEPSAHP